MSENIVRRALAAAGLVRPPDGRPRPDGPKRSRYGNVVSPRLEQDIDALRRRIEELERGRS
jgi:hypothetical protein